jgi:hypothetical protein
MAEKRNARGAKDAKKDAKRAPKAATPEPSSTESSSKSKSKSRTGPVDYVYEINCYYGVHYPIELVDDVLECLSDTKYASLGGDKAEVKIGKVKLFASTNSDKTDSATRGYISSDVLCIGGPDYDSPEECTWKGAGKMDVLEKSQVETITQIDTIYAIIVKKMKAKKKPIVEIELDWMAFTCCFEDDSEDEDSD